MRFSLARKSAATLLLIMCAFCGPSTAAAAGPLHTLMGYGQPDVTFGGVAVLPGQLADFTTYAVNSVSGQVTLVSASIVAVPGFPVARLRHVAVNTTKDMVGAGTNWPPEVKVRPFAGARLPRGQNDITFAISGPRADVTYVAAGLRITYRYNGQVYSFIAWSGGEACVKTAMEIKTIQHASPRQLQKLGCNQAEAKRITNALIKIAG